MPRRRAPFIRPRRPIFVGCEGGDEIAVTRWLQRLCDEEELAIALRAIDAAGGDTLAIVQTSLARRRQQNARSYSHSIILLDADRLVQDGARAQEAIALAQRERIDLIFARPSIEGTLVRLIQGQETRIFASTQLAKDELQRRWPTCTQPLLAEELAEKFVLDDLIRLAKHDPGIHRLLDVLGLI